MRDYLFKVNKENAIALQKKYSFDDYDTDYIYRNFWPIIVLTDISIEEFQELLNQEKKAFIDKRNKFVIEIFKRDYLDYLIYELKEYLDNINRGKNKIYLTLKNTNFHWFKLKFDIKSYTLLLSKKDETDLEIYLIDLLNIIELFISENEALQSLKSTKQKPKELLSNQITNRKKVEIANAIREKYSSYKGKDFKILYEALLKLDLFIPKGKRSLFFRCLQNEGYNIKNPQMLEEKYFKTGYTNLKGKYEMSEDEIQRDTIIEYLKTIIETK